MGEVGGGRQTGSREFTRARSDVRASDSDSTCDVTTTFVPSKIQRTELKF